MNVAITQVNAMTEASIVKALAEFFLEEFAEDAAGVGEWLAQNGQDVNAFYETVKLIKAGATERAAGKIGT